MVGEEIRSCSLSNSRTFAFLPLGAAPFNMRVDLTWHLAFEIGRIVVTSGRPSQAKTTAKYGADCSDVSSGLAKP